MSKERFELLTDEQYKLIEPLLPVLKRRRDNRGRPWTSNRACPEGILWVLRTGAQWRFVPRRISVADHLLATAEQWEAERIWLDALRTLLAALMEKAC